MLSRHVSITNDDTTSSLRFLSRFSLRWASFFQSQDQNLFITKPQQYTSPASNYTLSSRCARRDLWICTRKLKLVTFLSPVVCLRKEKVSGNWRRLVCIWSSREVEPQFNVYTSRFFRLSLRGFFLPIFV